jgi:protein gp37
MAGSSKIEWTEATWNPIVGCSIVSPGCTNCYAMKMAGRIEAMKSSHYDGTTKKTKAGAVWTGKLSLAPDNILFEPLRRKKPTTYFVNSMGDLFHGAVPDEWIDRVFAVMALAPRHTFQVLTKRAERMRGYCGESDIVRRIKAAIIKHGNSLGADTEDFEFFGSIGWKASLQPCKSDCTPPCTKVWSPDGEATIRAKDVDGAARKACDCYGSINWDGPLTWPLPNVWLGVSTERQQEANERIPHLLATPAAVRFVSAEPLLGPINLRRIRVAPDHHTIIDALDGYAIADSIAGSSQERAMLDWVIVGGESGSEARPMHPDWARSLRDQCASTGTAFFFKQWGTWGPIEEPASEEQEDRELRGYPDDHIWSDGAFVRRRGKKAAGRLLDGVEHNDMPGRAA